MISHCRTVYPGLNFVVGDAANLAQFDDESLDAVLFSFNGIGHLEPRGKILHCLQEVHRVLKPGGYFLFPVHHARSLFFRLPEAGNRTLRSILGSIRLSLLRCIARCCHTAAFWRADGYIWSAAHGGMQVYVATPGKIIRLLELEPDDP